MKVRLTFGMWEESPEAMPTLVAAVDEYTEENVGLPDDYVEAVDEHRREYGEVREVIVSVPDHIVIERFKAPDVRVEVVG